MTFPFIGTLLQQATAHGSRSTVLRPLGWLTAICMAGLLGSIEVKASNLVVGFLLTMTSVSVALYLVAYVFCLVKDRDALRSETYSIQKFAIEKGVFGDNSIGLIDRHTPTSEAIVVTTKKGPESR